MSAAEEEEEEERGVVVEEGVVGDHYIMRSIVEGS